MMPASSQLILAYGIALGSTVAAIIVLFYFGIPALSPSADSYLSLMPGELLKGLTIFEMNSNGNTLPANNGSKAVIIAFDDGWASQYTTAKPILDKFGFKATFFIVCNLATQGNYMDWDQIKTLQKEGHDIESHTMNHQDLTQLSLKELRYEVVRSKECLSEQGIDSRIFAVPFNNAWNNATVIDTIARYYDIAKNGNDDAMHLQCDGLDKVISRQTDCRTYNNGELTFANRYSIRAWSHNYYDDIYEHNDTRIFEKFVQEVNENYYDLQAGGNATSQHIPVLEYHRIDEMREITSTSPSLFLAEMQYLHDNGFVVLTMDDLHYDETLNRLYVG